MSNKFQLDKLSDRKIIKFLSVGVLNTVFGYAVYAALLFINIPYLIALFVATVVGVLFNYFSFGRVIFQGHSGWPVFTKFITAYLLIYSVNAVLLKSFTVIFILNHYIGQIICIPISVLLSWLLMNYWVYKK